MILVPQLLSSSSSLAGWTYLELMKYSPMILVFSITQQFKQFGLAKLLWTCKIYSNDACSLYYSIVWVVRLCWISLNWRKVLQPYLFFQFLGSSSSSSGLNYPELKKILLWSLFSPLLSTSSSLVVLNFLELKKNSSIILVFFSSSSSSVCFNHPVHMRNYPMILVPSITQ